MLYALTLSALGTTTEDWANTLDQASKTVSHINLQNHIIKNFPLAVQCVSQLEASVITQGSVWTVAGFITLWVSAYDTKAARGVFISQAPLNSIAAIAFPGVVFEGSWDAITLESQEALNAPYQVNRATQTFVDAPVTSNWREHPTLLIA